MVTRGATHATLRLSDANAVADIGLPPFAVLASVLEEPGPPSGAVAEDLDVGVRRAVCS